MEQDGTGRGTPIVVSETGSGWWSDGVSPLRADPGGMPSHVVAQTLALRGRDGGATAELGGDVATALRASQGGGDKAHVLAFDTTRVTSKLNRSNPKPDVYSTSGPSYWREGIGTLKARDYKDGHDAGLVVTAVPRRLTPTECERLQGFPDNWTAVDGMKDGPRYRQMGNAVTVNVVEWIGHRILEAERSQT